jgi:hypothetical protein
MAAAAKYGEPLPRKRHRTTGRRLFTAPTNLGEHAGLPEAGDRASRARWVGKAGQPPSPSPESHRVLTTNGKGITTRRRGGARAVLAETSYVGVRERGLPRRGRSPLAEEKGNSPPRPWWRAYSRCTFVLADAYQKI